MKKNSSCETVDEVLFGNSQKLASEEQRSKSKDELKNAVDQILKSLSINVLAPCIENTYQRSGFSYRTLFVLWISIFAIDLCPRKLLLAKNCNVFDRNRKCTIHFIYGTLYAYTSEYERKRDLLQL